MRKPRAYRVSRGALGVASVTVGTLTAIGLLADVIKLWSWLTLHTGISVSQMSSVMQARGIASLLVGALATWIGYGLWRLAAGRPGETLLLLAFIGGVVSLALSTFVLASGFGYFGPDAARVVGGFLFSPPVWSPVLGLTVGLLFPFGLLRSGLVAPWIVAIDFAAVTTTAASAVLVDSAWRQRVASDPLGFGAALARFAWVGYLGTGLSAVFIVILGLALLAHARSMVSGRVRGFAEV